MTKTGKTVGQSSRKARAGAARLAAVQAVYQQGKMGQNAAVVIAEYRDFRLGQPVEGEEMVAPDEALFSRIVQGVEARRGDLQAVIQGCLTRKPVENSVEVDVDKSLDPLLEALLLCGGFELMAHHDIDAPIVISDYLHVTHAYYDQGESRLVNAVLDKMSKVLRDNEEG